MASSGDSHGRSSAMSVTGSAMVYPRSFRGRRSCPRMEPGIRIVFGRSGRSGQAQVPTTDEGHNVGRPMFLVGQRRPSPAVRTITGRRCRPRSALEALDDDRTGREPIVGRCGRTWERGRRRPVANVAVAVAVGTRLGVAVATLVGSTVASTLTDGDPAPGAWVAHPATSKTTAQSTLFDSRSTKPPVAMCRLVDARPAPPVSRLSDFPWDTRRNPSRSSGRGGPRRRGRPGPWEAGRGPG